MIGVGTCGLLNILREEKHRSQVVPMAMLKINMSVVSLKRSNYLHLFHNSANMEVFRLGCYCCFYFYYIFFIFMC